MSTAAPLFEQEALLYSSVVDVLQTIKGLHVIVTSLMTDIAAIRRTVLVDPDFAKHYKEELRAATKMARPLVDEAVRSYDQMIGQMEALYAWKQ